MAEGTHWINLGHVPHVPLEHVGDSSAGNASIAALNPGFLNAVKSNKGNLNCGDIKRSTDAWMIGDDAFANKSSTGYVINFCLVHVQCVRALYTYCGFFRVCFR